MNRLYLLCGLSFAGKTTLRERMVATLDLEALSFDEINAERGLPFGGEGFPEAVWAETLEIALARLEGFFARRRPVVVDDTFCYRWLRDRFREKAVAAGYHPLILYLDVERAVLEARIEEARRTGGRPALSAERWATHLLSFEPPAPDESAVRLSTPEQEMEWLVEQIRCSGLNADLASPQDYRQRDPELE